MTTKECCYRLNIIVRPVTQKWNRPGNRTCVFAPGRYTETNTILQVVRTMHVLLLLSLCAVVWCQDHHHPVWELVYNSIDLDHNGQFSIKEFHVLLPKFDHNGDGSISEAEFMDVWDHATAAAHNLARDDAAGRTLFHMEDYDKDGVLTMAEAEHLFTVTFDTNSDGIVTKLEFEIAWYKIHDHSGHNPTGMSMLG